MVKIFLILFTILAINVFYSAQPPIIIADETKTFIGTIESFGPVFARPPKWPIAKFKAIASNGERIDIYVLAEATIVTDIDGKLVNNKKPRVGKKVEVKYLIGENGRNEAISMHYLPADYIPQITAASSLNTAAQASTTTNVYGERVFTGRIESSSSIFGLPPKRKLVLLSDKDDRLTVFVSKEIAIRNMNAAPTRIGKRAKVKYLPTVNGDNEAVSFRYLD